MKRKNLQSRRPILQETNSKPFPPQETKLPLFKATSCSSSPNFSKTHRKSTLNKENPFQLIQKSPNSSLSIKSIQRSKHPSSITEGRTEQSDSLNYEKTSKNPFNYDIELSSINPSPCHLTFLESQLKDMKNQIVKMNEKLKEEEKAFFEKNIEHDYLKVTIQTLQKQLDSIRLDKSSVKSKGCVDCRVM
jgi:hypothetical protein